MLKIIDSISSVSKSALISSWNKARGLEPTEKPWDLNEDELIELELSALEEPEELSDDRNEPNAPKK